MEESSHVNVHTVDGPSGNAHEGEDYDQCDVLDMDKGGGDRDKQNVYANAGAEIKTAQREAHDPAHRDGEFNEGSDNGKHSCRQDPLAKKSRTLATSPTIVGQAPPKKSRGAKDKLKLLPTMPLDILFEIFGFVGPKDILSISRTNKLFRQTLMSKRSITVWKAARERSGVPDCPEDFSEPAWAMLLFEKTCQSCDAKNVQKVDFMIRRRICLKCKMEHLLDRDDLRSRYPNIDDSVASLIPYTEARLVYSEGSGPRQLVWLADVEKIVRELAAYQHNVQMGHPDAQRILDSFKAKRLSNLQSIREHAQDYDTWYKGFLSKGGDTKRARRLEAVRTRFIELGYAESDLSSLKQAQEVKQNTELNDRIWERIRPLLEPAIFQAKKLRLESELEVIKESRRQLVQHVYSTYKRTLQPSQLLYLPQDVDIYYFRPFLELIDAPADMEITASHFNEAIQTLPEVLSAISIADLALLRSSVNSKDSSSDVPNDPTPIADPLDMATSVFECSSSLDIHVLVGLRDLRIHCCEPTDLFGTTEDTCPRKQFSSQGAGVARKLIKLALLDARTATVSDMDAKDLRFTCSCCAPRAVGKTRMLEGFSWRAAIAHEMDEHWRYAGREYTRDSWRILSPEDSAVLKKIEEDLKPKDVWMCNHCMLYLDDLQHYPRVIEHLKSMYVTSTYQM